jgi:PleD family two-component response regulator
VSKPPPELESPSLPSTPEQEFRPTPWPSFDLEAYARDSETELLATETEVDKIPTAPPPRFHPASIRADDMREARQPRVAEMVPPPLRARILECAERTHLLRTQLRIGGLTREEAARALSSELATLETQAEQLRAHAITSIAIALRAAIEELGGIAGQARGLQFDVIVLDDDGPSRARVALSVESLGHIARGATTLTELAILASERMPDAIFVAASVDATTHHIEVCTLLREVVRSERVAIVVYADEPAPALERLARAVGAERYFRAEFEIEAIMEQLSSLFAQLLL